MDDIHFTPFVSATTMSVVPPPISIVTILVTSDLVFWKNEYGATDSVIEVGTPVGLKYFLYAAVHKRSNNPS